MSSLVRKTANMPDVQVWDELEGNNKIIPSIPQISLGLIVDALYEKYGRTPNRYDVADFIEDCLSTETLEDMLVRKMADWKDSGIGQDMPVTILVRGDGCKACGSGRLCIEVDRESGELADSVWTCERCGNEAGLEKYKDRLAQTVIDYDHDEEVELNEYEIIDFATAEKCLADGAEATIEIRCNECDDRTEFWHDAVFADWQYEGHECEAKLEGFGVCECRNFAVLRQLVKYGGETYEIQKDEGCKANV